MISLFVGEERDAKRDRLDHPLQVLDRHIDFAVLAKAVNAKLVKISVSLVLDMLKS